MFSKKILLLGAGRSTGSLISYLSNFLVERNWQLIVGDFNIELAQKKTKGLKNCSSISIDITQKEDLYKNINSSDLVISMIPANMHSPVAEACIELKKPFFTASYVSKEISALHEKAKDNNVLILMEMGLDPGIDHMSAMHEIDDIKKNKGTINLFKSFTGGLIAPESDDNPWNYKFTWNPRNVILAGQDTVKFIRNGKYKYITYHNLFKRLEPVYIDGFEEFEGYANRDSLKYRDLYNLKNIPTLFRGTLRRKGFCEAWDVFVQLGMTEDNYTIDCSDMTYREFINSYLVYDEEKSVEEKTTNFFKFKQNDPTIKKLKWIGIFSSDKINLKEATPAQVLQKLLESKWQLKHDDKDMVVMQHQFEYSIGSDVFFKTSSLVIKGENAEQTSMAKSVGLPLGIAAKLYLDNKIQLTGINIPTIPELYSPILEELKHFGISFNTKLHPANN